MTDERKLPHDEKGLNTIVKEVFEKMSDEQLRMYKNIMENKGKLIPTPIEKILKERDIIEGNKND